MSTDDFAGLPDPDFSDEDLASVAAVADSGDFDYSALANEPIPAVETVPVPASEQVSSETVEQSGLSSLTDKDLETLQAAFAQIALDMISEKEKRETKPRVYSNLGQFVKEQIGNVITREIDGKEFCWCSQWWKHAEALQRLEGLWHSWEHARATGASMLDWWRDFDYHFGELTSSQGVFKYCRDSEHSSRINQKTLPVDYPSDKFFEQLLGDIEK